MGFIVKIGEHNFVKRTARFGPFHGRVVWTESAREARVWTQERHAKRAAFVVDYHRANCDFYHKKPIPDGLVEVLSEPS